MRMQDARRIVIQLAEGINPLTDEKLDKDNVLHNPEIIRALYTVLGEQAPKYFKSKKAEENIQKRNEEQKKPVNHGLSWSLSHKETLKQICYHENFKGKPASLEFINSLAELFGRTSHAVFAQMQQLKLLPPHDQLLFKQLSRKILVCTNSMCEHQNHDSPNFCAFLDRWNMCECDKINAEFVYLKENSKTNEK